MTLRPFRPTLALLAALFGANAGASAGDLPLLGDWPSIGWEEGRAPTSLEAPNPALAAVSGTLSLLPRAPNLPPTGGLRRGDRTVPPSKAPALRVGTSPAPSFRTHDAESGLRALRAAWTTGTPPPQTDRI